MPLELVFCDWYCAYCDMSVFEQLWRLEVYGSDYQNRETGWWYENGEREPVGTCCLQFVMEGSVVWQVR